MSPENINDLVEINTLTLRNFRAEKQAEVPRVNTTRYGRGLLSQRRPGLAMDPPSKRDAGCRIIPPVPKADPWLGQSYMWLSSMFNLIAVIRSVQFLLIFSLSAVLLLFLTVCVFLIFRLGRPFVVPFSLFA